MFVIPSMHRTTCLVRNTYIWDVKFIALCLEATSVNRGHPNPKCVESIVFLAFCFHLSVNNQVRSKATQEATCPGYSTTVQSWDSSLIRFQREGAPRLASVTSSLLWESFYLSISPETTGLSLKITWPLSPTFPHNEMLYSWFTSLWYVSAH